MEMNNLNVHYGNLDIISIHVEFINPSFVKLSFMKQKCFWYGRAKESKVVYLFKKTKTEVKKTTPALSFYDSL